MDPAAHSHGDHWHIHEHGGAHRHLRHPRRSAGQPGALSNPTYRRLLAAQIGSLAGTAITTVALALLAFEIAGANAGAILGGALALKMVAYVGLSPVIAAFADRVDRRRLLITLDLARAGLLATLPFVSEVWQVFAVVFLVNACAAGFTPAFQATIPEVLPDEDDYTQALAFSRVAYDLADLLAPIAAAGLLLLVDFQALFAVNTATFLISAALIATTTLPSVHSERLAERSWERISAGVRRFFATPRLRAVLALNVAVASASAMVIVNTVVIVREQFGLGASAVAVALACAAAGSVIAALNVPSLVRAAGARTVMLTGTALLPIGLLLSTVASGVVTLLAVWFLLGAGMALVQTPIGRLLQRSARPGELPALFAAQFALSHLAWLVTYLLAGALGAAAGLDVAALALGALAAVAALTAALLWRPSADQPATEAERRTGISR